MSIAYEPHSLISALCVGICNLQNQLLVIIHKTRCFNFNVMSCQKQWKEYTEKAFLSLDLAKGKPGNHKSHNSRATGDLRLLGETPSFFK